MKLLKPFSVVAFIFFFTSCKKENTQPPVPLAAKSIADANYGTDALQKMDIYLPQGRTTTTTKILVLIHGGSWIAGDKTDFNTNIDSLKLRLPNYAIFNINYRLASFTGNLFPTQENDVKAAIQYINDSATAFNVSKSLVLLGASAGGHLAMLQGFKYTTPLAAKAIVSFFGPSDMVAMYNNPASSQAPPAGIAILLSGTPTTNATMYAQSSPINFITSTSAPTILLHGGADSLVQPTQSTTVQTKLAAVGVTSQYVFYPTGGHGNWDIPTFTDAFNKIQTFLTANVK